MAASPIFTFIITRYQRVGHTSWIRAVNTDRIEQLPALLQETVESFVVGESTAVD